MKHTNTGNPFLTIYRLFCAIGCKRPPTNHSNQKKYAHFKYHPSLTENQQTCKECGIEG